MNNYHCKKTNFLHYYQVISAIPKHLLTIARNGALIKKELYLNKTFNFQLDESTQIDLIKIRTSDFYKLFNTKINAAEHRGPQKWNNYFLTKKDVWKKRFASLKTLCTELLLQKENFFVHDGIQSDDDCIYCGEKDSIDHTLSELMSFCKKIFS